MYVQRIENTAMTRRKSIYLMGFSIEQFSFWSDHRVQYAESEMSSYTYTPLET